MGVLEPIKLLSIYQVQVDFGKQPVEPCSFRVINYNNSSKITIKKIYGLLLQLLQWSTTILNVPTDGWVVHAPTKGLIPHSTSLLPSNLFIFESIQKVSQFTERKEMISTKRICMTQLTPSDLHLYSSSASTLNSEPPRYANEKANYHLLIFKSANCEALCSSQLHNDLKDSKMYLIRISVIVSYINEKIGIAWIHVI